MRYGKLTASEDELFQRTEKAGRRAYCSNVLKKLGVEHTIHHTSIDEAKSTAHDYDLIVVGENFVNSFNVKEGTKVIGLKNLMNKKELETKLKG